MGLTDVQVLIALWIPVCVAGMAVAVQSMARGIGDKNFLRTQKLNGIREVLVDVNFSEALSHFGLKFVYGLMGLWALVLRVQNPMPLTLNGWVAFLTLFVPILWLTATDVRNYRRKKHLVQALVRDTIDIVRVQRYRADTPQEATSELTP